MKILKTIIGILTEPFKYLNNKNLGEKVTTFFNAHKFMYYLLATIITLVILFFIFVFPNLI